MKFNSPRGVKWLPRALGIMVAGMGLAQIGVALFPGEARYLRGIEPWTPFHIHFGSRALLLASGVSLLALGRGIARRKQAAWWLAAVALGAGPILHLGLDFSWQGALASAVPLLVLLRARPLFKARSDAGSLRFAGTLAACSASALLAFGWVVLDKNQVGLEGRQGGFARLQAVAELVFLQSSDTLQARTAEAQTALFAISFAGAATILLVVLAALRPVLNPPRPTVRETERARRVVQSEGRDPLNEFALSDDKRLFFTRDGRSLIAYALWRNFALTLADPIGPAEGRRKAIREFMEFCAEQDWEPVFYETGPDTTEDYAAEGFTVFKIGECAVIPLQGFSLSGKKYQDLRTARSRAGREGLVVRWLEPGKTPEPALAAELKAVSDGWLERKRGGEMSFDLGAFSEEEIIARGAAVAIRENGRVEAFATWLPYNSGNGLCLDLMRARPEVPGVMDFVIVESLLTFQARGIAEVSLANAPLANIRPPSAGDSRHERAVRYVYENFNRIYGYKNLFHFKNKYNPHWRGRHLAYRHRADLPFIAYAIVAIHSPGGLWRMLRS